MARGQNRHHIHVPGDPCGDHVRWSRTRILHYGTRAVPFRYARQSARRINRACRYERGIAPISAVRGTVRPDRRGEDHYDLVSDDSTPRCHPCLLLGAASSNCVKANVGFPRKPDFAAEDIPSAAAFPNPRKDVVSRHPVRRCTPPIPRYKTPKVGRQAAASAPPKAAHLGSLI